MNKPDFLCIGAQRCGSSWLYEMLRQHPGLWLPPVKELHYFDTLQHSLDGRRAGRQPRKKVVLGKLTRISTWMDPVFIKRRLFAKHPWLDIRFTKIYSRKDNSLEWYQSFFYAAARKGLATGEVTPAYAILPRSEILKIHSMNSDLKIILVLRDPVKRAWSHAMKDICRAYNRNPEEVDEKTFLDFFHSDECVSRSDYVSCLERWESVFPKNQIHIVSFDGLAADPEAFLEDVFVFLEVDPGRTHQLEGLREMRNASAATAKPIPPRLRQALAEQHLPGLRKLAKRFPFAQPWLNKYEMRD
ncbi:MAG: sulfotransferase domain-containing protein [Opitutales bacterium]|nr:sulfotransferase domain-containing protein [Opitutales bacterium]